MVDGRRSSYSVGLTLKELAEEFLAMGCIAAINFDGGGSSALSMRIPGSSSSKTINSPSDSSERSCATYVLFVTDNKADGVPKHLSLSSDGKMVLAGSVINLEAKATDTGFLPSSAPGDIVYTSTTGLGTFSGKTYTAGQTAGKDTIGMSSAETGASGSGTLHILTNVDSITVKNKATNKAVTSISLKPGETFQFDTSATYLTRSVLSSAEAYQYTVSGDIGTVSNTGLYTAGGTPGASGTITVSFGGVSKSVSVTVAAQLQDIRGHWAETYIRTLFDAGIVEGVSDTEFLPNANISRGDFILMMYRSANKPSVSQSSSFSDVKASDYYASAIAWAEEKGIAQGTGDGKFNPTSPLTREQAFAFLYRALSLFGVTYTDGSMEDLAAFPDCGSVSDYAVIPTATLVNLEFVGGSDGLIVPQGKLTRAEMSKILCCMLETV